jgi:hypothetical protein
VTLGACARLGVDARLLKTVSLSGSMVIRKSRALREAHVLQAPVLTMSAAAARSPSDSSLLVSCLPRHAATQGAEQASVVVTTIPGEGSPAAIATATLRRPRRSEHEEIWAQLYIDGAFVDVTRASEIDSDSDTDYVTLIARFGILTLYLDSHQHHVRVCFVGQVSRIVPRGESGKTQTISELAPQAIAEAEFSATVQT